MCAIVVREVNQLDQTAQFGDDQCQVFLACVDVCDVQDDAHVAGLLTVAQSALCLADEVHQRIGGREDIVGPGLDNQRQPLLPGDSSAVCHHVHSVGPELGPGEVVAHTDRSWGATDVELGSLWANLGGHVTANRDQRAAQLHDEIGQSIEILDRLFLDGRIETEHLFFDRHDGRYDHAVFLEDGFHLADVAAMRFE